MNGTLATLWIILIVVLLTGTFVAWYWIYWRGRKIECFECRASVEELSVPVLTLAGTDGRVIRGIPVFDRDRPTVPYVLSIDNALTANSASASIAVMSNAEVSKSKIDLQVIPLVSTKDPKPAKPLLPLWLPLDQIVPSLSNAVKLLVPWNTLTSQVPSGNVAAPLTKVFPEAANGRHQPFAGAIQSQTWATDPSVFGTAGAPVPWFRLLDGTLPFSDIGPSVPKPPGKGCKDVTVDPDGRPRLGPTFLSGPMAEILDVVSKAPYGEVGRMNGSKRYMVVYNASDQDLWIGLTGASWQQIPLADTGFRLKPCTYRIIALPQKFSGRIWARTGCRWMRSKDPSRPAFRGMPATDMTECKDADPDKGADGCLLVCSTGNCGAANELAASAQCGADSGQTPATLIEFTLGDGVTTSDFYDNSNVDGTNLIGGLMMPLPNGRCRVPAGADPKMSCSGETQDTIGRSGCWIRQQSDQWCPVELQYVDQTTGKVLCNSICSAINDPMHYNRVPGGPLNPSTKKYRYSFPDGSVKEYTPYEWLMFLREAKDWLNPEHINVTASGERLEPMMRDRLCEQCGANPGKKMYGCEEEQSNGKGGFFDPATRTCVYGCSPYSKYPAGWWSRRAIALCKNGSMGCQSTLDKTYTTEELSSLPAWPLSLEGKHYAGIYHQHCPLAYTHAFSDLSATYQALNADYLVAFF